MMLFRGEDRICLNKMLPIFVYIVDNGDKIMCLDL